MLRDIEKETIEQGMYIRILIRLINSEDMPKLLTATTPFQNALYVKKIKYKEKIDEHKVLMIYYAPFTYQYSRLRDMFKLFDRIHNFLKDSKGYMIDFITTNQGTFDFKIVGSEHYLKGEVISNCYKVDDSILTTLTFYSQDAFNAAEKYRYLSEYLLEF